MKTVRTIGLFAAAVSLAACSQYLPRYTAPLEAAQTGFYENIQTPQFALLEFRLARYLDRDNRPYPVICAAAGRPDPHVATSRPRALDKDVEIALITRFPDLSPLSRCERDGLDIVASDTQQPAAIFDVHDLACERQGDCLAWAGYYANGHHGWAYYRMIFENGTWRIKPEKIDIVPTGSDGL